MSHKNRTPVNISTTGNQVQETQIDNGEMLNLSDSIKTKNQDRSKAGKTTGKFSGETKITTNHLKGMLHLNAQRDGLNLLSEILLQEKNPVQYLLKEGLTGK